MAVINAYSRFKARRRKSIPVVKIPGNVREAFNIAELYEFGIAKLEKVEKDCLYDRSYIFEDVNYINRDEDEKEQFLNQFMAWIKTVSVDFKITIANEYQSMEDFLDQVRHITDKDKYPRIADGVDQWIRERTKDSGPNVTRLRYLTITCRANTLKDAQIFFRAADKTISIMFSTWKCKIQPMDGMQRLIALHSLLRPGRKDEESYIKMGKKYEWKNDIYPGSIRTHSNFMVMDDTYFSVLYSRRYTGSLDSDTLLQNLSNTEYPSFLTMDYSPVPADEINDFLTAAGMNVDKAISDEEERRRKKNIITSGPSYAKQRKKDEVESLADQVSDNEETGFFLNFLMVITAPDEEMLGLRVQEAIDLGKQEKVVFETANFQQIKALNTALPIGGRQVDFMRFFLSSSVVAFQPFHSQDIIEPGGIMYGINRTTGNPIIGNRKLLPNPHGFIAGHTGFGKSAELKALMAQTMMSSDDDVLVLDPQNEFQEFTDTFEGKYFDLTPKSGIHLNGFEVYDDVFYADHATKQRFIATQTNYAKNLMPAIMNNIVFTQEHASVVGRCMRRMLERIFDQSRLKIQPTLRLFREEVKKELELAKNDYDRNIIRPIYNSLEEYTEGSCDMLAYPSNIRFNERLVGFGLKNIPEDNWEPVMLTIMHYVSSRLEYNQKARRAVHFIVDEAQVVSQKGTSAEQLCTAVVTFRKWGGIMTLAMQNIMAAREHPQLRELFSNCSFKCFLDQSGMDAEAIAEIQELSRIEYAALQSDEVGKGVIVWGKKVALFDALIPKNNPLYELINTNFHEKREEMDRGESDSAALRRSDGDGEHIVKDYHEKDIKEEASGPNEQHEEEKEKGQAGPDKETEISDEGDYGDPDLQEEDSGELAKRKVIDLDLDVANEGEVGRDSHAEWIILRMASYQDVSLKDIMGLLPSMFEKDIAHILDNLICREKIRKVESPLGTRFRINQVEESENNIR